MDELLLDAVAELSAAEALFEKLGKEVDDISLKIKELEALLLKKEDELNFSTRIEYIQEELINLRKQVIYNSDTKSDEEILELFQKKEKLEEELLNLKREEAEKESEIEAVKEEIISNKACKNSKKGYLHQVIAQINHMSDTIAELQKKHKMDDTQENRDEADVEKDKDDVTRNESEEERRKRSREDDTETRRLESYTSRLSSSRTSSRSTNQDTNGPSL